MNKVNKILELLNGEPTLWDAYAYEKPWTDEELNSMLQNEALLKIPELALQFNRPQFALIAKYFELRSELDGQVVCDVMIMKPADITWEAFRSMDYTLDDLVLDQTIMNAKVGDYVKVNIRTLIPFSPETPVATFHSSNGAIQGHHGGANKTDPNRWAYISAQVINTGHFNLGTMITGLKRSVMFIVEE